MSWLSSLIQKRPPQSIEQSAPVGELSAGRLLSARFAAAPRDADPTIVAIVQLLTHDGRARSIARCETVMSAGRLGELVEGAPTLVRMHPTEPGRAELVAAFPALPWTLAPRALDAVVRAERINGRVRSSQLIAEAVITDVQLSELTTATGRYGLVDVHVTPAGRAPFVSTIRGLLPADLLAGFRLGSRLRVRYDPEQPTAVIPADELLALSRKAAPAGFLPGGCGGAGPPTCKLAA